MKVIFYYYDFVMDLIVSGKLVFYLSIANVSAYVDLSWKYYITFNLDTHFTYLLVTFVPLK